MPTSVDLQNDEKLPNVPAIDLLQRWVDAALTQAYDDLEQTVRVVGEVESRELNRQFRGKDSATNVLSFPSESDYLDYSCLGDLVICVPVVESEAAQQGKSAEAHWAHMVVHGMLHLQGLDHQSEDEAEAMEAQEVKILSTLGYENPYNERDNFNNL